MTTVLFSWGQYKYLEPNPEIPSVGNRGSYNFVNLGEDRKKQQFMIRKIITPKERTYTLEIPESLVEKKVEVIAFELKEN